MKTKSLPSVEEKTLDFLSDVSTDVDLSPEQPTAITSWFRDYMTQRDNQAYTSLVEGIEGMKKYPVIGSSDQQIADSLWRNDTLTDVIENVVKPLYGKT